MSLKGSRRVRAGTVLRWMSNNKLSIGGSTGGVLALFLLSFLAATGAIDIWDSSGDISCTGTPNDLCVAVIKFEANTDIFVYPNETWGLDVDKPVKNLQMFRTWGDDADIDRLRGGSFKFTRKIKLNETCKGTWCGGKFGATGNAYSFAFRKGRNYTIIYTAEKEKPFDVIKWGFGFDTKFVPDIIERDYVDPIWDSPKLIHEFTEDLSMHQCDYTRFGITNESLHGFWCGKDLVMAWSQSIEEGQRRLEFYNVTLFNETTNKTIIEQRSKWVYDYSDISLRQESVYKETINKKIITTHQDFTFDNETNITTWLGNFTTTFLFLLFI